MMCLPGQLNTLFSSKDYLHKYPNVTDYPIPVPFDQDFKERPI